MISLHGQGGGRGALYYDNGPRLNYMAFDGTGLAPHGGTVRATYSPPVGRLAYIEFVSLTVMRSAAAAPAGRTLVQLRFSPATHVQATALWMSFIDNVVGVEHSRIFSNVGILTPDDALEFLTYDLSTGGTVDYLLDAKICEFDYQSWYTKY